jgi:hypothetical protein
MEQIVFFGNSLYSFAVFISRFMKRPQMSQCTCMSTLLLHVFSKLIMVHHGCFLVVGRCIGLCFSFLCLLFLLFFGRFLEG